eukprot:TRINITY_DN8071_c0_g1_i1.p1 TRINITY_DN8071_c0_g1~~TRINITY_DN8071_c0_g1_i1.p1  ORF type:complete len:302 (+),score=52.18 TRINITY_DN8071_c0_g1_i1:129-1034(+)
MATTQAQPTELINQQSPQPQVQFFQKRADCKGHIPEKPLGVLFVTSLRDIVLQDNNGEIIKTNRGDVLMEGIIHRTFKEVQPGGHLHGLVDIVGIIFDDTEKDIAKTGHSPSNLPKDLIFPADAVNAQGVLLNDLIHHIPSMFRKLPISDAKGRETSKHEFENEILSTFRSIGADFIASDHYMARIDYLHKWLPYRVLNIHPAVSLADHQYCFRGKTPTKDAIERAQQDGKAMTGATLHYVSDQIDEGNPIAFSCSTPVYPDDDRLSLLYRNYQLSKLPIFIEGLAHYVKHIYPHLELKDR